MLQEFPREVALYEHLVVITETIDQPSMFSVVAELLVINATLKYTYI